MFWLYSCDPLLVHGPPLLQKPLSELNGNAAPIASPGPMGDYIGRKVSLGGVAPGDASALSHWC